jgi:hypothetical protein
VSTPHDRCESDRPTTQLYAGTSDGAGSRCFLSTLSNQEYQVPTSGANCYMTSCTDAGTLQLVIKGAGGAEVGTFDCPIEGGDLAVDGYSGAVDCPPAAEICGIEAENAAAERAMQVGVYAL